MATTPTSPAFFHPPAGQETMYCYRFDCKATGECFIYLRDFGWGQESAAQLVRNMATGEVVIRKVIKNLCFRENYASAEPFRPIKPNEIEILEKVRTWPDLPDVPRYISECYSHEYIKIKETKYRGVGNLYRSIGMWKLCNGGSVFDADHQGATKMNYMTLLPLVGWARYVWQIVGTLQFLGWGNPHKVPLTHGDGHPGNIFIHWNDRVEPDMNQPETLLPDFILGDFGHAAWVDRRINEQSPPKMTKDLIFVESVLEDLLQNLGVSKKVATIDVVKKLQKKIEDGLPLDDAEDNQAEDPLANERPAVRKLYEIYQAVCDLNKPELGMTRLQDYPNLMHIVQMGKEMEAMCLEDAELMEQPIWKEFAVKRRAKALALSRSVPFVTRGTQEEAMKPINPKTNRALILYEPWTLCALGWKRVRGHPIPPTDPRAHTDHHPGMKWAPTHDIFNLLPEITEDPSRPIYDFGEGPSKAKSQGRRLFDGILRSSGDKKPSADFEAIGEDFVACKLNCRPETLGRNMVDAGIQTEAPTTQPATKEADTVSIEKELEEMSDIVNTFQVDLDKFKEMEAIQRKLHTLVCSAECECDNWPVIAEDKLRVNKDSPSRPKRFITNHEHAGREEIKAPRSPGYINPTTHSNPRHGWKQSHPSLPDKVPHKASYSGFSRPITGLEEDDHTSFAAPTKRGGDTTAATKISIPNPGKTDPTPKVSTAHRRLVVELETTTTTGRPIRDAPLTN